MKPNDDIRAIAKACGVRQWQVAEQLNISEFTFSRWMRVRLSDARREAVLAAIRKLAREGTD